MLYNGLNLAREDGTYNDILCTDDPGLFEDEIYKLVTYPLNI